jgi:hypothetical protein
MRSFLKIFAARVVSVMVGAIAFTRTVDASSAPNDFTSPSTPACSNTSVEWHSNFTATVLNNRIDGLVPFFKTGRYF